MCKQPIACETSVLCIMCRTSCSILFCLQQRILGKYWGYSAAMHLCRFMEARGEVLPSAHRFTQMSKHRDAQDVNRNCRFLLICFLRSGGNALIRARAHRDSFQTQIDSFCVTTAGLEPWSGSGLSESGPVSPRWLSHFWSRERTLDCTDLCLCVVVTVSDPERITWTNFMILF